MYTVSPTVSNGAQLCPTVSPCVHCAQLCPLFQLVLLFPMCQLFPMCSLCSLFFCVHWVQQCPLCSTTSTVSWVFCVYFVYCVYFLFNVHGHCVPLWPVRSTVTTTLCPICPIVPTVLCLLSPMCPWWPMLCPLHCPMLFWYSKRAQTLVSALGQSTFQLLYILHIHMLYIKFLDNKHSLVKKLPT